MANSNEETKRIKGREGANVSLRKSVRVRDDRRRVAVTADQDLRIDLRQSDTEEEDPEGGSKHPTPLIINGNGNGGRDGAGEINLKLLAEAGAISMGQLFLAEVHSIGLGFEGAVSSQGSLQVAGRAAALVGVSKILALTSAEQAAAARETTAGGLPQSLASILAGVGNSPGKPEQTASHIESNGKAKQE